MEKWDLVIEAESSLLDLKINDIWRYRDLLYLLVKRDFIAFYKQTIFGPIWFFVQPLFTMGMYVFIFGNLAQLSTDGLPKPLFYLSGIIAWTYFAESLSKTATVFKDNASIFGKVYFPRLIMPLSIVISNLVKFFVQFALLLLLIVYYSFTNHSVVISSLIFFIPILVSLMAIQALGLGMIISSLTTKYRDLSFLLTFGIQLMMYATTVVYPLSSLKGTIKTIVSLNPMTYVIEGFRLAFLGTGSLDLFGFIYLATVSLFVLLVGVVIFNKVEKDFIDTI